MKASATAKTLSAADARRFLVSHLGLARVVGRGARGVRAMLERLGCVQVDPLDPMGTNADLVALARVDGIARGDVYRHLLPGHAFEHFAKERCLIAARAFPYWRDQAIETPWWRLSERTHKVDPKVVRAVLAEVRARGPISAAELEDHGRVDPVEWSGWKGTAKTTSMALEILWTQCRIVVCGRDRSRGKLYDVPDRALAHVHGAPREHAFERFALLERVESAGLLARGGGACWSMLRGARTSGLLDELIAEGAIEELTIEGASRPYLAPRGFRDRKVIDADDRMRILGPLDALLWDRDLVRQLWGFEYVWEVYKKPELRRWGWYVSPLLHRGELVGRLEGRVVGGTLVIERLYREPGRELDEPALDAALQRHAVACGADRVKRPKLAKRSDRV